jgi:hypothetical protein
MRQQQNVTLENLGHGAAAEMFQKELENVIANIVDPNTKPDAVRTITLKMKVKPGKDRGLCSVEIACDCKVASVQPFETAMYVGMEHGVAAATEYAPQQANLFPDDKEVQKNNLIAMNGGR